MRLAEFLLDVLRPEVDRRREDVGRGLAAQLDDVLAEVGFDRLDSRRLEGVVEADLLGDHRLALGDALRAHRPAQVDDDGARFLSVLRVVDLAAARADLGLVGLEVKVEMRERVVLDRAGAVAQRLELGQSCGRRGAPGDEIARKRHRALQARVRQRLVRVLLELGRSRDHAHGPRSGLPSPIAGPSAIPARISATWRALIGDPSRLQLAGHVHQTPEIAREHRVGAGAADVVGFLGHDRVREFAVFGREQAAEAATGLPLLEFDQRQALDLGQKPPRLRFDPELAQAGAGIVIGDRSLIARVDLVDAHDVDQEADQFVRFFREPLGPLGEIRLAREQVGIVLDEHAAARPARRDHIVAVLERLDRLPRQPFRGRAVAGIIRRLTAAGLARHDHFAARILEQLDRGESDARPDDVDEAGDEEPDARLRFPVFPRRGRRRIHRFIASLSPAGAALLSLSLRLP